MGVARPRAVRVFRGQFLKRGQGVVWLFRLGVEYARMIEGLGHIAAGRITRRQTGPVWKRGGAGLFLLLPGGVGHRRRGRLLHDVLLLRARICCRRAKLLGGGPLD